MVQKIIVACVLISTLLIDVSAKAGLDVYGLGDGHDGPLSVTTKNQIINAYSALQASTSTGSTTLCIDLPAEPTLASVPGFAPGRLIMIHQSSGLDDVATGVTEPAPAMSLAGSGVGRFEFGRITTFGAASTSCPGATSEIVLDHPLLQSFLAPGTQVLTVPEFTDLTVATGASIVARSFDGARGGVAAFLATGAITVHGEVHADGAGFRGGAHVNHSLVGILRGCTHFDDASDKQSSRKGEGIIRGRFGSGFAARGNIANAGGGGNCTNAGGAGGGHGGRGGAGGKSALLDLGIIKLIKGIGGIGGAKMNYDLNMQLLFGGGGGAGEANLLLATPGTRGGGIVLLRADSLAGTGRISANGEDMVLGGLIEGGGGAGAGGAVILRLASTSNFGADGRDNRGVRARGGAGGHTVFGRGAGGGGGGGRVLVQASNGISETFVDTKYGDRGLSGINLLSVAHGEDGKAGDWIVDPIGFETPAAPVVLSPADGVVLLQHPSAYSGTATPGTRVWVFVNDSQVLGPVTTNGLGAWTVPATPLPRGSHTVQAAAASSSGTATYSVLNRFRIAPPAPTLSTPLAGSIFAYANVEFGGTAELGSQVLVHIDGREVCRATTLGSGEWRCTAVQPLDEGEQLAVAIAEDAAGNQSLPSAPVRFTVDTIAPNGPIVIAPADGGAVGDEFPLIRGTAEPHSSIAVILDNAASCTTVSSAAGSWECVADLIPLTEGSHEVYAIATDEAGNVSPNSLVNTFQVILTIPAAPVVIEPAQDDAVSKARPDVRGTAAVGMNVEVFLDGTSACSAVVDGTGAWECESILTLSHGPHTVYAVATDALDQESARSSSHSFFVYLDVPAAPTILSPADGSATASTKPVIEGIADAGAQVRAYIDGVEACQGVANRTGEWACIPGTSLGEGRHEAYAIATDPVGRPSLASDVNTFWVYLSETSRPVLLNPADGSNVATVRPRFDGTADELSTVKVFVDELVVCQGSADASGAWDCMSGLALSRGVHSAYAVAFNPVGLASLPSDTISFGVYAGAPAVGPEIDSPADGSVVRTANPPISGTGDPAAVVEVTIAGEIACTSPVAADGNWGCVSLITLVEGTFTVDAVSVDPIGNVSPRSLAHTFTVDFSDPDDPEPPTGVKPTPPSVTTPSDDEVTNDPTPTVGGEAEAGTIVSVFIDGVPVCTAITDATGRWICTPVHDLDEGDHEIVAVATDTDGNSSNPSAPIRFTVDTTAPPTPTVDDPTGRNPTLFTGTAEPGTRVRVSVGGEEICSVVADERGRWSCSTNLPGGDHTVEVTSTDEAGNESPKAERDFRVETKSLGKFVGGGVGCSSAGNGSGGGDAPLLWLLIATASLLLYRRRPSASVVASATTIAAVLGFGFHANAQAKLPGFELERLRINPSAQESLVVGTADLLEAGGFRLAIAGHYQHDPLVYEGAAGDRDRSVVGSRLGAQLSAAYGITRWLEAGVQLPVVLLQRGDDLGASGYENIGEGASMGTSFLQLRAAAFNEVRGDVLDFGVSVGVGVPFGSAGSLTGDDGVTVIPQLEAGRTLNSWLRVGGNAGVVLRPKQSLVTDPARDARVEVGNEVHTGIALTTLGEGLRGELSTQLQISLAESPLASELWAGVRYPIAGAFELYALAGPGFGTAPGTPTFRTLAGVAMGAGSRRAARSQPVQVAEPIEEEEVIVEEPVEIVEEDGLSCDENSSVTDACHVAVSDCGDRCTEALSEGKPLPVEFSRQSFYFDTGKAAISLDGKVMLERTAEIILAHPSLERVLIEGHTDDVAGFNVNLELSHTRANAVRDHLEALGVPAERMETRGHAFQRPAASNRDDEGRSLNRRVEIFFMSADGQTVLGR